VRVWVQPENKIAQENIFSSRGFCGKFLHAVHFLGKALINFH